MPDEGAIRLRGVRPDLLALLLFVVLAVAHTWPLASHPAVLSRNDNADTMLNEWIPAWVAHQLPRDPLHLFDANIFFPERDTLAFSEHMFVQAVMGAPLYWAGVSPVLVYNLLLLAGFVLNGWAVYLVMSRWTGDRGAAIVAGAVFAFNAHIFTRLPHLQALHSEFMVPAIAALLWMLDRPRMRAAIAFAVLFVLQALCSNYTLVYMCIAVAAVLLSWPRAWASADRLRELALPAAVAVAIILLALVPFLLPYYRAHLNQGLTRTLGNVAFYSGTWRDYLSTPGRLHFTLWSKYVWGEGGHTPLFPGALALVLAGVAIVNGTAFKDNRARAWLAIGVAGFVLSFGVAVPGYGLLYSVFPLLQGIRAPIRFGYLVLAAVAVLSGFGLSALRRRWTGGAGVLVATLALVVVTIEAFAAPIPYTPATPPPRVYDMLAREPSTTVVVEFPFPSPRLAHQNAQYVLNSTRHWRPMLNGYSGFLPASYAAHWEAIRDFPSSGSLAALREIGVTHVIIHADAFDMSGVQGNAAFEPVASQPPVHIFRLVAARADSSPRR